MGDLLAGASRNSGLTCRRIKEYDLRRDLHVGAVSAATRSVGIPYSVVYFFSFGRVKIASFMPAPQLSAYLFQAALRAPEF